MSFLPSLSLMTGEALLSLYPILIKKVKTDLLSQTFIRLITTTIVCYPFITSSIGSIVSQLSSHIVSLIYLVHIWSSYLGFRNLEVGVAITLFYTYPIINVIINDLFIVNKVDVHVIYYFLISFFGVVLISSNGTYSETILKSNLIIGIMAMIGAAITESLIYTFYKTNTDTNPFNMLFSLCLSGSILLGIIYTYKNYNSPHEIENSPKMGIIGKIVIANIIFGVVGYLLRFYSMHNITTEWFSILSFSGIIFGYLYGWFFYQEKINISKLIGTLLIIFSAYKVKSIGY